MPWIPRAMPILLAGLPVGAAHAQIEPDSLPVGDRRIAVGETSIGVLTDADQIITDGTHAQAWALRGTGFNVTIDLISGAFDAFLMLYGPDLEPRLLNDDGAGRCDARITHTLATDGEYRIIVNTARPGETGPFTLRVTRGPRPRADQPCAGPDADEIVAGLATLPVRGPIRVGNEISDDLAATDPRVMDDGPHALAWEIEGAAGEQVTLDLFSETFDVYLLVTGPGLDFPLSDDDCGGQTNARLIVTFPETGTYRVIVTSFEPGETGPFMLYASAGAGTPPCRGGGAAGARELRRELSALQPHGQLTMGAEVTSALTDDDPTAADGSHVRAWDYEGEAGTEVTFDLLSDAFDAFLVVLGPGIDSPPSDDDAGGGCNARITLTLGETGSFRVVATSLRAGATGAFTLRVSGKPRPVDPAPCDG